MKKSTIAQTFTYILTILQAPDRRKARKTLINIEEKDFKDWTENEKEDAALACSTYDAVGIMLKKKVIDYKMVTDEWRHSIIKCWDQAQPMVKEYRKDLEDDFWDDFEWLYKKAKAKD